MVQTADVSRELARFLAGELSLRDLTLWLAEHGWELRENASDVETLDALEVVRLLDLHLARYTSRLCTREDLVSEFRRVLTDMQIAETTWTISGQNRHSEGISPIEYSEVCV